MTHLAISTTVTRISLSLLLLAFSAHAHAITVPQIMRQAIQTGHANGLVEGPVAEKAKVSLRAQGPLNLSVTRLFEYAQEGCARLRMDFVQSNAFPPGSTKVADYSWSTEVSLCTDGQPPVNTTRKTQ
jgi:hypothetical protein